MDKYVINKIKEYKIKNDVNSDVLIHEYHTYLFENIEYIDIYLYLKQDVTDIKINDKCAINSNIIEKEKIICLTYLSDDVINNLFVTEYRLDGNVIKIKNDKLVNYNDYRFNDDDFLLIKKMSLKGVSELIVLPCVRNDYWICFCGEVNNNFKCNCGCLKEYVLYYSTSKKIHQRYAKNEFIKRDFISNDIEYELEIFKNDMRKEGVVNLNYLDDKFYDSLNDISNIKRDNFIIKKDNFKCILKNILLIFLIVLLLFVIKNIIVFIDNDNKYILRDNFVSKYCDNINYNQYDSIDDVIDDYSCGTFVWFISNNNLSDSDYEDMINSDNIELYELYYDVKKELLHNELDNTDIYNEVYLEYLISKNYSVSSDMLINVLEMSIKLGNEELFLYFVKDFNSDEYYWDKDKYYFNYNFDLNKIRDKYGEDKIIELDDVLSYNKYALALHKSGFSDYCYTADYGNIDNLKYLASIDKKNCDDIFSDIIDLVDSSYITMHYNVFGSVSFRDVYGNYFHRLTYKNNTLSEFEKKVSLLKKYGLNINHETYKDITPLDKFMEDNERKSHYYNADGAKEFDEIREYYKILKKYGAVCSENCDLERYYNG